MKKSILALLLGVLFVGLSTQIVSATNPISQEASIFEASTNTAFSDIHKESKSARIFNKIKQGVQNFVVKVKASYYKVAGMFSDPVKKWMWFWLLFGLLGLALIITAFVAGIGAGSNAIFNALWYLGWASSLFSSVSFVIWVIKLIQG